LTISEGIIQSIEISSIDGEKIDFSIISECYIYRTFRIVDEIFLGNNTISSREIHLDKGILCIISIHIRIGKFSRITIGEKYTTYNTSSPITIMRIRIEWINSSGCRTTETEGSWTISFITWPPKVSSWSYEIDFFPTTPTNITSKYLIRPRFKIKSKHISHTICPNF
jgi:hypothetical protein